MPSARSTRRNLRAGVEHRFGQQAAAATDVQHVRAHELRAIGDELRAHGIEDVQRLELARRIPEAMRERVELADFGGIGGTRGVRQQRRSFGSAPD